MTRRVVFVNRFAWPDHSATSQMLSDLAFGLVRAGFSVGIVTSRQRYDAPRSPLSVHETVDGVSIHRIWTSRFGRERLVGRALDYLSFYLSAAVAVLRITRRDDVVVVKTDPPMLSVVVGPLARLRGALVVNWLQDLFPEAAGELGVVVARGIGGGLMRWLRDGSLRHAAGNVAVGRLMQQRVAMRGVDPQKITVIPNWADGTALCPVAPEGNPLRSQWGLRDKFVIGYSGNMGRAHEFQTIVGAAAALRERSEFTFLFIGGGAQQVAIARAAEEGRLANVLFKRYQPRERLDQSLGAADVHLVTLQPALEGLIVPSKFYGILAAGRPTIFIGDPDGEIGTIVREAECGFCVSSGDVAALVAAILRLWKEPLLRERMGRNARRIFEERYDLPIAIGKWRRLLRDVAESNGS